MKKWLFLSVLFLVSCETHIPDEFIMGEEEVNMVVPENPTVWFPWDGDMADYSPNQLISISYEVELTSNQYSEEDKAIEFITDDVSTERYGDDFIHISHNNLFNEESITLSTWVYPETRLYNADNINYTIASRWNGGDNTSTVFRFKIDESGYLVFVFGDGDRGVQGVLKSSVPVSFNEWSHVTFTLDKESYKFYINDNVVDAGITDMILPQANSDLTIGETYMSNGYWYYFDGKMDNFGMWARALTTDEISDLYKI